jgi:hypothetical protein
MRTWTQSWIGQGERAAMSDRQRSRRTFHQPQRRELRKWIHWLYLQCGGISGFISTRPRSTCPVTPLRPNAACQLHCWAYNETHPMDKMEGGNAKPSGLRSHVMRCKTCKVNLCVKCWKTYHKQHRLKPLVFDILGEDGDMQ